jgi:hypothetical protein
LSITRVTTTKSNMTAIVGSLTKGGKKKKEKERLDPS